jgi:hypothetical protein
LIDHLGRALKRHWLARQIDRACSRKTLAAPSPENHFRAFASSSGSAIFSSALMCRPIHVCWIFSG